MPRGISEIRRADRRIVAFGIAVFNQRGECVHTGTTTTMMAPKSDSTASAPD